MAIALVVAAAAGAGPAESRSRCPDEVVALPGLGGGEGNVTDFARAEAAADLTAETLAAALRARHRFRPDGAPASAWMFGIAAHKLTDWRRRGYAEDRARRRLGMERIGLTAEDMTEIERMAGDVAVLSYVSDLPPEQSEAVRARILRERDYASIAAAQGVSEQVARKRVSRGLAALRERVAPRRL